MALNKGLQAMPLSKLVFKPGINRDQTNYASEGGWFDGDKIRFRSGFPEKIGGWIVQTFNPYAGVARAIFSWITSTGAALIALGTNEKIYVVASSNLIDITPIRATFTAPATNNCFATTNTSTRVVVTIAGHGAINGDYVTFSGVVDPIGGVPAADFNKEFKITLIDVNSFSIVVNTPATSTATGPDVIVSGTGWGVSEWGIPVWNGNSSVTAAFQLNIGNNNVTFGYGWGAGAWGRDSWGSGTTTSLFQSARLVFFQNFNNDLLFNIQGGDIYYWAFDPTFTTRAIKLSEVAGSVAVPQQVGKILFASTGHLFALGCTTYDPLASAPDYLGVRDPLLVRWANVDADIGPEPENWKPELTNTAGFFRLQAGSEIITAVNTRQETLIWTNTSLYSMQFLGTAEVFGQQLLSAHVSIMGPNAVTGTNNITYWMGNDKFYVYSGRVDTLPCTLRQYVFTDINRTQGQIFFAGSNAQFNEVIWFYCSESSDQINRYVIYNYSENIWYFGQLARTSWIDASSSEFPLAAQDGWVYEHENGNDDGQPLGAPSLGINSYIQSADIDIEDGDKFMLTRRVIPDVNFVDSDTVDLVTGAPIVPSVEMTIGVRNFPGAARADTNASGISTSRNVLTTATIDQYTNQVFVRARGRQMSFRISSTGVGTQWQLGMPRVDARPDGARG